MLKSAKKSIFSRNRCSASMC